MSLQLVKTVTAELPWRLRTEIDGYLSSVHTARFDIFKDAGIAFDENLYDRFIFIVGLRRLWSLVDSQYWILDNSLNLLRTNQVGVLEVGSTQIHFNSIFYQQISELRNQLMVHLREYDSFRAVESGSLMDLLTALR